MAAGFRAELATHHTFLTTIHLEQILLYRYLSFSEFCSLLIASSTPFLTIKIRILEGWHGLVATSLLHVLLVVNVVVALLLRT